MSPVLIARMTSCVLLAGNFAYLTYVSSLANNGFGVFVGVAGLLATVLIAVLFYLDHMKIYDLQLVNKALVDRVFDLQMTVADAERSQPDPDHH